MTGFEVVVVVSFSGRRSIVAFISRVIQRVYNFFEIYSRPAAPAPVLGQFETFSGKDRKFVFRLEGKNPMFGQFKFIFWRFGFLHPLEKRFQYFSQNNLNINSKPAVPTIFP